MTESAALRPRAERWLPWSIALVAGAALAYQVLLMRLLSIVHWYPFAAMIVSLALLGHGTSGALLAVFGARMRLRLEAWFAACAAGFALSAPLCFALAQSIGFNGLELVWDPVQVLRLTAIYVVLSVPFLFAASCFGLAFVARGERIPALYASDLAGAAGGAVAVIALMHALPLEACLRAIAAVGIVAAALALLGARRALAAALTSVLAGLVLFALPASWLEPRVNPFKGLSKTLLVEGSRVLAQRSSPLGLLHVVDPGVIPLRHVPGLSLAAMQEPVAQLALFSDGDALSAISTRPDHDALAYLGHTTSALPYALLRAPEVLVLGLGGGGDVLQALTLGAARVEAVELDPEVVALLRGELAAASGNLLADARVSVVVGDARNHLRTSARSYDLIVLPLLDSATGAGAGVLAAADSFLYTIEALRDTHARLRPGGFLVVTRWESQPPRDSLKLVATATAALRAEGITAPGTQLALIRSWQTSTLLLKRGALTSEEIARIAAFCDELSFDLSHLPGLREADANRFHVIEPPWLDRGARALLDGAGEDFSARYKFDVAPATDDRPFFHDFFAWRSLPELWRLRGSGSAALLDSGYLVLAASLAQALPLALALVLLPLLALRTQGPASSRWRPAVHFLCLGLAFLFVEIALLSRFTLLIGQPLLAATVVLAALLLFAGIGSACAARVQRWRHAALVAPLAAAALVVVGDALLPALTQAAAAWTVTGRVLVSVAVLAPLAFAMGLPFPLGLSRLAATTPALVPWAWGINGVASVLSALLALLLAIEFGYAVVLWCAAALYALAAVAWRRD